MTPFLQPQAALETAVVNAILAADLSGGYTSATVKRTWNGEPDARAGNVFVSVWSGGSRQPDRAKRTALDERFSLAVTITVRCSRPRDQWVIHRDDIECRLNAIRALIQQDALSNTILNAANVLAGYRNAGSSPPYTSPVGFCEALCWEGTDDVQEANSSWFSAKADKGEALHQTARFGQARRIQAIATAV